LTLAPSTSELKWNVFEIGVQIEIKITKLDGTSSLFLTDLQDHHHAQY
jgi:hypothetical protein